jgi:glycosyltransferase involved in cell wall biosynthesis
MEAVLHSPSPKAEKARSQDRAETVVLHARVVTGSGGGPDKTILNSPRFVAGAGYRMLCAYMHPPGDPGFEQLRKKAELWQAPLLSVPDRGPWDYRVVTQLLQICRRERVNIWHGHDYKSNALGLLLRFFWPMRLVTTVHGWGVKSGRAPLYYKIERRCLPYYERVICVSEDLKQQCLACGVPDSRCLLVHNAVDTQEFSRRLDIAQAKDLLGIPPERFLIGAVGRLSAEKGFDVLIRTCNHLLARGLDVGLIIVGDGEEREHLGKLIGELGREDRIRLLGYRSDVRGLYEAMDVYALTSYREGLPNVLLEAMALGVPVVATRVAGIPRLIQHEDNGLLVEPGAEADLTEQLARVLEGGALRDRLVRAGRQTIEAHYSFEKRMQKIRAIYDELMGCQ